MTTIKTEKRNLKVKAKALRRQGKITGNISGKDLKESIPVQFDTVEAMRFLKNHTKGSQALLDLDGEIISVLLKDTSFDPSTHTYNDINFQALVAGEKVSSTAPIILLNESEMKGYLQTGLSEIAYKAIPSALVDTIEIDLSKIPVGTNLLVGDLDIAKDENITILTPLDTPVLHITEHRKNGPSDADTVAAAEA